MASCWVMDEPPCTTSLARAFSNRARAVPMTSMPKCSKKRRSSVASVALIEVIGDLLERHGVVVQDAALADLVAVAVEEFDGVLAGVDLALVELEQRRDGEHEEHGEAADAERQPLGDRLVQEALPSGQAEAGEEAGAGVPMVADRRPRLGERGIDPGIEAEPVDQPFAAALLEEPVLHCLASRASQAAKRLESSSRRRGNSKSDCEVVAPYTLALVEMLRRVFR